MKYIVLLMLFFSCGEETKDEVDFIVQKDHVLYEDGYKTVFFENSTNIRFKGEINEDSLWNGRVTAYNRDGTIQSTSNYIKGLKYGNHQVFHSGGTLYYTGEYRNDTMVGRWYYYDKNGGFQKEIDYN